MQQPVAQLLRLGGGEVAVQEQDPGPGEQVDTGQGQLQPGLVDREVSGREPAEAGVLAAADAVLDAGVCPVAGLQELDGSVTGRGVGRHDLMPPAFDGVEQRQLGAGMRAFPAGQKPGALGPAGRVEQAGDLADFGVFA